MFSTPSNRRAAFTLVEAMVATVITAVAGSALLLGLSSSLKTTNDVLNKSIAAGIAQRLMDDISGKKYCEDSSDWYDYPLGPSGYEAGGVCRERYNDLDDYNNTTSQPPNDVWGIALGSDDGHGGLRDPNFRINNAQMANWLQTVKVTYVDEFDLSNSLSGSDTSNFRAVQVDVYLIDPIRGARLMATLRRVFCYVSNAN